MTILEDICSVQYERNCLLEIGARNCLLEIMSLQAIILHKTDFVILTVYRVALAELCALLINTFEKLHLINSEANLQHLKWSFL